MEATIAKLLEIPDIKVKSMRLNKAGDVIITVESTKTGTLCRCCGRLIDKRHGHDNWIELQHLPILGRRTFIRLRPKRYRCHKCDGKPTTTQKSAWYQSRCSVTKAFEEYLLLQLVNSTIADVSRKEAVGYETVAGVLERRVSQTVNWEEFSRLQIIGIDEIALRKGHKDFVAIITTRQTDSEGVRVLGILKDRKKATVKQFLKQIPRHLRMTVETVCTDMWKGYVNASKEVFGKNVNITVDRFHVAKLYRQGVDKLRQQECKRLKKELSEADYKQLKGAMWAFRKHESALNENEEVVLARLFSHSPSLHKAYQLRHELTAIFDSHLTRANARSEIIAWCEKVIDSSLSCFDSFATTLRNWFPEILNYFGPRLNSGFVEGFNNKIKTLKRRCYGILDVGRLFQRLYLDMEGYRLYGHPHF